MDDAIKAVLKDVKVKQQGTVVCRCDRLVKIEYPDGSSDTAKNRKEAEGKIKSWCKKNLGEKEIGVANIEWWT